MKIIFDLDHTLFRTSLFKADLFNIFTDLGVNKELIESTYLEYREERGGDYDFQGHLKKISLKKDALDLDIAIDKYIEFINKTDFSLYVETEVHSFLKRQRELGVELILITKGGREIQNIKLEKTGLNQYFDEIIICKDSKLPVLESVSIIKGDLLVNDLPEEIVSIRNIYPQLRCVLLDLENLQTNDLDGVERITSIRNLKP